MYICIYKKNIYVNIWFDSAKAPARRKTNRNHLISKSVKPKGDRWYFILSKSQCPSTFIMHQSSIECIVYHVSKQFSLSCSLVSRSLSSSIVYHASEQYRVYSVSCSKAV